MLQVYLAFLTSLGVFVIAAVAVVVMASMFVRLRKKYRRDQVLFSSSGV